MFASGLILYVSVRPDAPLEHILFGDMLGINATDILQTGTIALFILLITGIKWRDFLLYCFDIQQAGQWTTDGMALLRITEHDFAYCCRHAKVRGDYFIRLFAYRARCYCSSFDATI